MYVNTLAASTPPHPPLSPVGLRLGRQRTVRHQAMLAGVLPALASNALGVGDLPLPMTRIDHQLAPRIPAYEVLIDGGGDSLKAIQECGFGSNVIQKLSIW